MDHNCNLNCVPNQAQSIPTKPEKKSWKSGEISRLDQKSSWKLKPTTHVVDMMNTSLTYFDDKILPTRDHPYY